MLTAAELRDRLREQQQSARKALAAIIDCSARGDTVGFRQALQALRFTGMTAAAFRAVGKLEKVPDSLREAFVLTWITMGDTIRDEVQDDKALGLGLRRLLPRYEGGPVTLYRGDSARNRRHRSYGLSWSSSDDVARSFALGAWRSFEGGSVLLRCEAPAAAIICAIPKHHDTHGETEFLVDRRMVGRVDVVERFSEVEP